MYSSLSFAGSPGPGPGSLRESADIVKIQRDQIGVDYIQEKQVEREWRWVLECICKSIRKNLIEETLELPCISDTLVFYNGIPIEWICVKQGKLSLQARKSCTWEAIRRTIGSWGTGTKGQVATAVFRGGERKILTVEDMQQLKDISKLETIQMYVEPKGGSGPAALYRQEFSLHTGGREQLSSFKLGAPTASNKRGRTQRENIRSRNSHVNNQMEKVINYLIKAIEKNYRCRVTKMTCEFAVDCGDNVWLQHIPQVVTTEEKPSSASTFEPTTAEDLFVLPRNFLGRKALKENSEKRKKELQDEDVALKDFGLNANASLTDIAEIALSRTEKKRLIPVKERNKSMAILKKYAPPTLDDVEQTAEESKLEHDEFVAIMNAKSKQINSAKKGPRTRTYGVASETFDSAKEINAELASKSADMLGSSQSNIGHCPGDFCSITLDVDIGDEKKDEDKLEKLLREQELETEHQPKPQPVFSQGDLSRMVSYKSITQARTERKLVELLIRRMQKKEQGDYIQSVADLETSTLGMSYPVHYYRQVGVCEKCFKLYSKIEDARQKAMSKMDGQNIEMEKKLQALKKERKHLSVHSSGYVDRRINPFSSEGKALMSKNLEELRDVAIERSKQAINTLTKSDLAEFRSFQNPPSSVIQVSQALMILLTGKLLTWEASKRVIANGERFLAMLLDLDADCIPPNRITDLEPFAKDRSFRPYTLNHICKSAAVLCEYILGTIQAHKYKLGTTHPRNDPLLFVLSAEDAPGLADPEESKDSETSRGSTPEGEVKLSSDGAFMVEIPQYLKQQMARKQGIKAIRAATETDPVEKKLSKQRKAIRERKTRRPRNEDGNDLLVTSAPNTPTREQGKRGFGKRPRSGEGLAPPELALNELTPLKLSDVSHGESEGLMSPKGFSNVQHRALAGTHVAFNRHESIASVPAPSTKARSDSPTRVLRGFADDTEAMKLLRVHLQLQKEEQAANRGLKDEKPTRRELRARRRVQERQMQRLHGAAVTQETTSEGSTPLQTFLCSDKITKLCYDVVGHGGLEGTSANLIIVHDIFDTFEQQQILVEPILRKFPGSQALVFNYPGQASTQFPSESVNVLNNEFIAATLHELLAHLDKTGEFSVLLRSFYLVGIGNGANIAARFAVDFSSEPMYRSLAGLVSVNGYSYVDEQLAAILHSSVNVFSCFPPSRPDLPISYFIRFLFSDSYLKKVVPALVLNIYTAVGNPITLQGRVQLCNGALRHKDTRAELRRLGIPVILMQSTENVLVNPTNVDPFLEGRAVSHVWSHQLTEQGKLGPKGIQQLRGVLGRPDGAFVMWIKAGHEVRQEAKPQVLNLLEALIDSKNMSNVNFRSALGSPGKRIRKKISKTTSSDTKQVEDVIASNETKVDVTEKTKVETKPSKQNGKKIKQSAVGPEPVTNDTKVVSADVKPVEKEENEFEEALRRHRETKRLAEEARKKRLLDLDKKLKQEEELLKLRQKQAEEKQLKEEEKKREQLEKELEARRKAKEEEFSKLMESKQKEAMKDIEEERKKAKELSDKLQKQLKEAEDAQKVEAKLRDALGESGLDYDKVVREGTKHMEESDQPNVSKPPVIVDESDIAQQIQLLRYEQEERRRKWEAEDRRRIEHLERELLKRAGGRAVSLEKHQEQTRQYIVTDAAPPVLAGAPVSPAESTIPQQETPATSNSITSEEQVGNTVESSEELSEPPRLLSSIELTNTRDPSPSQPEVQPIQTVKPTEEPVPSQSTGVLDKEEYERVKAEMKAAEEERERKAAAFLAQQNAKLEQAMALRIQAAFRGYRGRTRFHAVRLEKINNDTYYCSARRIQAMCRGRIGRKKAIEHRTRVLRSKNEEASTRLIQRVARGMLGRNKWREKMYQRAARGMQGVIRRFLANAKTAALREQRDRIKMESRCATNIQSAWRMHRGREEFLHRRVLELAAVQIQRIYRGCRGRRKATRKKTWAKAEPGPERLELGLTMIEESKAAFSAQQEEIDALHRAQERAEARVSQIHAGLQESEKELAVLEQELRNVDALDQSLHQLAHEKSLHDAKSEAEEQDERVVGTFDLNSAAAKKRAAESYALEMQIHIKRAERERKKKELEAEFGAVFQEVETKRSELRHLETNIEDMEATRRRKEREFQRLQRNLMELLEEQKNELDNLRERGIELETATASSAAAAAATAAAAKENEERSKAMFTSTEELLKFQFMSMSLSYFSSMNMLKSLRDINSDTTNSAISSSADTAAAAIAAAKAANIPDLSKTRVGQDAVDQRKLKERKAEVDQQAAIVAAKTALEMPFPDDVRKWTVEDVSRWLDTLSLSQYRSQFQEACIDGEFLLELRCEDMRDILGMKHALHVQKIDIARNKLRPLNEQGRARKNAVVWESQGDQRREELIKQQEKERIPDVNSVFSQIRNGRYSRVESALDLGFDPNETDSHGNTALIVAAQNLGKRICELLLNRGANVNHQNSQGNTAMHYAMSYDPEGTLGEFLIGRGADDTLENKLGCSVYDGID